MIRTRIVSESAVSNPASVFPLLSRWRNSRTEKFIVITLNAAHVPIHTYVVSSGLVNRALVHPREVFWYAVKDMACAIIIAHNHPSGRLDPSPEDREITERLHDAGRTLGIPVLDHIIFGRKAAPYSFVASGLLSPSSPQSPKVGPSSEGSYVPYERLAEALRSRYFTPKE